MGIEALQILEESEIPAFLCRGLQTRPPPHPPLPALRQAPAGAGPEWGLPRHAARREPDSWSNREHQKHKTEILQLLPVTGKGNTPPST